MGKLSGFLPANLAIFLNSESLSMTLSYAGRLACGIHPSPYAIARLAPYGEGASNYYRWVRFCIGFGLAIISENLTNLP